MINEKTTSKWLTIEEASTYMKCSGRYLRELVINKQIAHVFFAGKILFHPDKLDEFLLRREIPVETTNSSNKIVMNITHAETGVDILPHCNKEKVDAIVQELIDYNEHFVTGLGTNLKNELNNNNYQRLSYRVYSQLSRWCWPGRNSIREQWVQPKAHELSKLLFGRIIDRTNLPSYK